MKSLRGIRLPSDPINIVGRMGNNSYWFCQYVSNPLLSPFQYGISLCQWFSNTDVKEGRFEVSRVWLLGSFFSLGETGQCNRSRVSIIMVQGSSKASAFESKEKRLIFGNIFGVGSF